jgi:hypothetical protein
MIKKELKDRPIISGSAQPAGATILKSPTKKEEGLEKIEEAAGTKSKREENDDSLSLKESVRGSFNAEVMSSSKGDDDEYTRLLIR